MFVGILIGIAVIVVSISTGVLVLKRRIRKAINDGTIQVGRF